MKPCRDDQIRNPDTGRCVKRDGEIGRRVIASGASRTININKKCKDDKIVNPETGRCVKRDGEIGRRIVSNMMDVMKQCEEEDGTCTYDIFAKLPVEMMSHISSFTSRGETENVRQTDNLRKNYFEQPNMLNNFYEDANLSREDNIKYQNSNLLHFANIIHKDLFAKRVRVKIKQAEKTKQKYLTIVLSKPTTDWCGWDVNHLGNSRPTIEFILKSEYSEPYYKWYFSTVTCSITVSIDKLKSINLDDIPTYNPQPNLPISPDIEKNIKKMRSEGYNKYMQEVYRVPFMLSSDQTPDIPLILMLAEIYILGSGKVYMKSYEEDRKQRLKRKK